MEIFMGLSGPVLERYPLLDWGYAKNKFIKTNTINSLNKNSKNLIIIKVKLNNLQINFKLKMIINHFYLYKYRKIVYEKYSNRIPLLKEKNYKNEKN